MSGDEPVAERSIVLDVLRGAAILGILFLNLPFMGASIERQFVDVRLIGWTALDRTAWASIAIVVQGTARAILELLFGAAIIITARRGARAHVRRNLWLFAFGLINIFVLLWPGDILHIYAIAALIAYPLRRLPTNWLVAVGLSYAVVATGIGAFDAAERGMLTSQVEAVEAAGGARTAGQERIVDRWGRLEAALRVNDADRARFAAEDAARAPGSPLDALVAWTWRNYFVYAGKVGVLTVVEALCTMLLGMALWRGGVLQGGRDRGFYLRLMLAAYASGLTLRALGTLGMMRFSPEPHVLLWASEPARLAVALGHVALVNWAMQTRPGVALLAPLVAAGRTAFSLYLMQSLIALALFAPFGLALWGRFSHAGLAVMTIAVIGAQLLVANLWLRHFAVGPFEWLWRWLSTGRPPRFRG